MTLLTSERTGDLVESSSEMTVEARYNEIVYLVNLVQRKGQEVALKLYFLACDMPDGSLDSLPEHLSDKLQSDTNLTRAQVRTLWSAGKFIFDHNLNELENVSNVALELAGRSSLVLQEQIAADLSNGIPVSHRTVKQLRADPSEKIRVLDERIESHRDMVKRQESIIHQASVGHPTDACKREKSMAQSQRARSLRDIKKIESEKQQLLSKTASEPSKSDALEQLHLQEVEVNNKLRQENEDLQRQLNDTIQTSDSFDTQLSDKEKEVKRLERELKKMTELVSGIKKEQNDPIDLGMLMTGMHSRVLICTDDAKKYGQISQYANDIELKNKIEDCAVDAIKAWLSVLSEMRVLEVTDSLN